MINGEPIWAEYGHPIPNFPLLTTYDPWGEKLISWDWDTKKLTLSHHGESKVYDFMNWTTSGDEPSVCSGDVNEDNVINVLDVQALVNLLESGQIGDGCLDINADQQVDEGELQSLVNQILSGQ